MQELAQQLMPPERVQQAIQAFTAALEAARALIDPITSRRLTTMVTR